MFPRRRDEPMPVKHWSFAGLVLTYWCNARCASCYLCCSPARREEMTVEQALAVWESLASASPRGCRIHLTGGEPFGDWPRLIEACRRARAAGLGALDKVETNAYWAGDRAEAVERLRALDAAGMGTLGISADPYHQQYVPIERCRLLAAVAEEVLGAARVQVRWRDWLAEGSDTSAMGAAARWSLLARYAGGGRDRYNGRAAAVLAPHAPRRSVAELADAPCRESLLRSRHVHVDGGGVVMPGTCAGLVLGRLNLDAPDVAGLWRRLEADWPGRAIVGALAAGGPAGLLERACAAGYRVREGYASKCHLCWEVRSALAGEHADELGPAWMYETAGKSETMEGWKGGIME
jgi:hypothetical protein